MTLKPEMPYSSWEGESKQLTLSYLLSAQVPVRMCWYLLVLLEQYRVFSTKEYT